MVHFPLGHYHIATKVVKKQTFNYFSREGLKQMV